MAQEETELVLSCNSSILKALLAGKMWKISGGCGMWFFFNNWVNQAKLCWTVQLVHQIFTRGSAASTCFYYPVFIHQCSSIKCKSPWGYLLLGTKNYWKNPSESTLTRLEQVENMLSGQTQHDSLSEHLMSLAAKSPLSHLMLRKGPFFFSIKYCYFPVHRNSYSIPKVTRPVYIIGFALVLTAADNSYRIKNTLSEGSFQQVCIYPLLELDYMFLHARKLKVKLKLSLVCLREYVLNQTISVNSGELAYTSLQKNLDKLVLC